MKHIFTFVLVAFLSQIGTAQTLNPVKWTFATEQLEEGTYKLIFTANVDDNWQIYSQFTGDDGPVPTSFNFNETKGVDFVEGVVETGNKKEGFDELFGTNVIKFIGNTTFTQIVKVKKGAASVSGYLEYMTCDGKRCLPPTEVDFTFDIK